MLEAADKKESDSMGGLGDLLKSLGGGGAGGEGLMQMLAGLNDE